MKDASPTTVRLNGRVHEIKDKLSPIYGLKNVLSAGLILFNELSAQDQKAAVAKANMVKIKAPAEKTVKDAIDAIKKLIPREKGVDRFVIPDSDTQAEIDELRRLLGPEPKKKGKKA